MLCTQIGIQFEFHFKASEWRVWLRDYPTNLILATELDWSGILCGAEQRGREELNFRDVIIDPGLPWNKINVPRNLCPLRFFHDLTLNCDLLEFGWGPS